MHYTGLRANLILPVKYLIVIASLKTSNLHNTAPSLARKGGIQRSTVETEMSVHDFDVQSFSARATEPQIAAGTVRRYRLRTKYKWIPKLGCSCGSKITCSRQLRITY